MSDTHYNDAADLASQASPGEQLKRERESQGLSRDDVATALNLRPAVVVGLEEDRYDEVPIAAYRRGYLRAYARLLGIEERPILDAYTQRFGHEEPAQHTTPVQVTKPPSRLGAWLFKLVTLLVIAGLIGLTLMWWQSRGGSEPPDVGDNSPVSVDGLDGTPSVVESSVDEGLPPLPEEGVETLGGEAAAEPDAPAAPPASDEAADSATNEAQPASAPSDEATPDTQAVDTAPAEEAAPSDAAGLAATEPAAETETPEPAPAEATEADEPAPEATAAEADPRVLSFTFNQQSWTEVFDASEERIFVGLQEPGTSARVEGEPPFRLTVGNATGVELVWRGEAVDLGARAGANNVARFTLGE
ncbi:RodZ domain-containing protein [Halomonas sp. NO4]|uniref:RodZ domain-containing protein n=1 Tax=Halomonas sp. NO4 TaxID=2484813 RepID=UPI0013D666BF|nr:RodZ domain-containing protein [Halomonas sp. NO4]